MSMTRSFIVFGGLLLLTCVLSSRSEFRRVCYYTNWAQYRPGIGKFLPEDIDTSLCTHLMYAFAKLEGNRLAPFEWNDIDTEWSKGMYTRFNDLKLQNPSLKTLLSVGGWNMGVAKMSAMLSTAANRREFVTTSIAYVRGKNFDGLDLDFEYPGSRESPPGDKKLFTVLLEELRAAFDAEGIETGRTPLLLTAAVAAGKLSIDNGYEVEKIAKYLDFIGLMTYDFNGAWDATTGHNSPLNPHPIEIGEKAFMNVRWSAEYWASLGAPKDKLVVGLPTYGRCFTLSNPSTENGLGALASGPCDAGTFTREEGFLAYYEICQLLSHSSTQRVWSKEQQVPYLINGGNVWVGYDDPESLKIKSDWIKSSGYGGWMVWTLDLDDFTGSVCGGQSFPLLRAINNFGVGEPLPSAAATKPTEQQTTTTTTTTAAATNPPSSGDFTCTAKLDGYYASPVKCTEFYQCVSGTRYRFDCPSGLYFNDVTRSCDWLSSLTDARRQQCQLSW